MFGKRLVFGSIPGNAIDEPHEVALDGIVNLGPSTKTARSNIAMGVVLFNGALTAP